jgi:hypothetical protein
MSSVIQYIIEGSTKPFGLFGRYWVIAGMVVFTLVFLNYLWQYISVRRVSHLLVYKKELTRKQVSGLPAIHSAIELFEAGHRSKLPHIPFICPTSKLTIDDPWQSRSFHFIHEDDG